MDNERGTGRKLTPYLSPLNVWALSLGCAVGWGAFVMPGTTFLPAAGPLGTALGIAVGAAVYIATAFLFKAIDPNDLPARFRRKKKA